ncbi:hypothetical protein [Glutamicibacter soli]|uniref:hypothetical protein n=1 Tax=Glutamicibacter soli TaxID=453836 RepID=UPI003FD08C1F
MNTAPAPAMTAPTTHRQDIKLCYFFNQEHRECFEIGLDALTLCGEWISPTQDVSVNPDYTNPHGETVLCPNCQAEKDRRTGGKRVENV